MKDPTTDAEIPSPVSNLAVIRGAVAREPVGRALPTGATVVQFDVVTSVQADGGIAKHSVPIAWHAPPTRALAAVTAGVDVMIVGTVRRRFFRAGGATQSRTEVVADSVIPARRRTQVTAALARVAARFDPGDR